MKSKKARSAVYDRDHELIDNHAMSFPMEIAERQSTEKIKQYAMSFPMRIAERQLRPPELRRIRRSAA